MYTELLNKLRGQNMAAKLAGVEAEPTLIDEFLLSGVSFVSTSESLESRFYQATQELFQCITAADHNGKHVWLEGGPYRGCWLESTGTINSEVASRFIPSVSQASFELYADLQRADGLMPYKWTKDGPAYKQIQLVTPLARSVWNHYLMNGRKDKSFLSKMFDAMRRYDEWLHHNRNTRETGCIEAFCTFDTGHDSSSRFWHVPDTPHLDDPAQYDPDSPILPFLAPDLTANVYAQRIYIGRIAEELGFAEEAKRWAKLAEETLSSLMEHCYDEQDAFFYDVDRHGRFVRLQSDVLLRVLACEVGDDEFFAETLRKYLLNTRKFFSKYPLTSIAMDDPRFDPFSTHNSWGGAVNMLTLIRTPHAFEHHHRHVELTWIMQPILSAFSSMPEFAQCISPWTGEAGYTRVYGPSILTMLDYIERLCGILIRPEGTVWFTGLTPYAIAHGKDVGMATAYSRTVDGVKFEIVNTVQGAEVYRDEQLLLRLPRGVRAVTGRDGTLRSIIGMSARTVEGTIEYDGRELPFRICGNEQQDYRNGSFEQVRAGSIIPPSYE
jgi:hypothetical protein